MSDYICGRRPVMEYLKAGKEPDKVYIQRGERKGSIHEILHLAKESGAVIVELDKEKLDRMSEGRNHQGVVILATDFAYADLDAVLAETQAAGRAPFLIILEEISDPHNLGAIIRTAECCGVDAVIIPKRRSAMVNETVQRTSSGATAYQKICRVTNINQTIDQLKKANIWVYGAAGEARQSFWATDFSGPCCLVIGNEGAGLSRLTREKCDVLVSIPMLGKIDSLNASASAAVLMYEVLRGRMAQS